MWEIIFDYVSREQGLIPDRRAASAEKIPAPPPPEPEVYVAAWLREQQGKTTGPQPNPALDHEAQEEDGLPVPEAEPAPGSAADEPSDPGPIFDPGESTFANRLSLSETQSPPYAAFAPDARVPFSIGKNPFARRR